MVAEELQCLLLFCKDLEAEEPRTQRGKGSEKDLTHLNPLLSGHPSKGCVAYGQSGSQTADALALPLSFSPSLPGSYVPSGEPLPLG